MADALACTVDDIIELSISPTTDDDRDGRVLPETVTWLTDPEHAGTFAKNDDPATGAKFTPLKDGDITIAVAAATVSGKILRETWKLHVTGREATKLNLRAQIARGATVSAAQLPTLEGSVATGQGPAA